MSSGRQDPAEALLSGIERDIERGGRSRGDGLHSRGESRAGVEDRKKPLLEGGREEWMHHIYITV